MMNSVEEKEIMRKFLKLLNADEDLRELIQGHEIQNIIWKSPTTNKALVIDYGTIWKFEDENINGDIVIYNITHSKRKNIKNKEIIKELNYIYGSLVNTIIEELDR